MAKSRQRGRPIERPAAIRNSAIPAYYQIWQHLKNEIETGKLKAGHELPSEYDIAKTFGVNRLTVRRAIRELVTHGLLIRQQGRHTQVAPPKIAFDPFGSFTQEATKAGLDHEIHVVDCRLVTPEREIRERLQTASHAKVLMLLRVRYLDGRPCSLERTYITEELAHCFLEEPSRGEDMFGAFTQYCGLTQWQIDVEVGLVAASPEDHLQLKVREGQPLLSVKILLVSEGRPFSTTDCVFLADRFNFTMGARDYRASDWQPH